MIQQRVLALAALVAVVLFAMGQHSASATGAYFSQACTSQGVDVTLHWLPAANTLQQYVAFGEDLQTLTPFGPLDGTRDWAPVGTLTPNKSYVGLVLTQSATGSWSFDDSLPLTTFACVVSNAAGNPAASPAPLSNLAAATNPLSAGVLMGGELLVPVNSPVAPPASMATSFLPVLPPAPQASVTTSSSPVAPTASVTTNASPITTEPVQTNYTSMSDIDRWVERARAAYYAPPVSPPLIFAGPQNGLINP